jgi:hypothetical protein
MFEREGILYRHVDASAAEDFALADSSGLMAALHDRELLVPHEEDHPLATERGAYKVLRPERIPFVSYPYEWSFSQLRDAALLTLRIQELSMDHGMSLRDASAYNVQFRGAAPILIDTLSFERLTEGRPWVAYRQFCEHFLAPLALMSYRDVRLGQLTRVHLDGVPLDLTAILLPRRAQTRPPLMLHVFAHAKSQRRHAQDAAPAAEGGKRGLSPQALRGLLDSLRKGVESLAMPDPVGAWADYEEEATHYSESARAAKETLVDSWVGRTSPASVWDLGANTGRFSRLASARGIDTVAFDLDAAAVDENYRRARDDGDRHLLPLVLDLANPSPAIGWANRERMTVGERGPADLVLALALIHHLAIAGNVPLPMVAEQMAGFGRRTVVEFVPKDDEKVRRLLMNREDVFPDYSPDGFEAAFGARFEIEAKEPLPGSTRTLYLLRRR